MLYRLLLRGARTSKDRTHEVIAEKKRQKPAETF
jgi:hypothetical protein